MAPGGGVGVIAKEATDVRFAKCELAVVSLLAIALCVFDVGVTPKSCSEELKLAGSASTWSSRKAIKNECESRSRR